MGVPFTWPGMDDWIMAAIKEDLGSGDVTTEAIVAPEARARMEWIARSELVVCGLFVAERVFSLLDPEATVEPEQEGSSAAPGDVILKARATARALLTGERVALNAAQRLSGVAALTRRYVEAVSGTKAVIAATRKTTPGMRLLEKYAVTVGGGAPHRFGLDDGVLIKDNHIVIAGSVAKAVSLARRRAHHLLKVEVEVTDLSQAREAVEAGADILLLDNMGDEEIGRVVKELSGRVMLEASGNMTLERAAAIAALGVDAISVGALTHSAPAPDISARMVPE